MSDLGEVKTTSFTRHPLELIVSDGWLNNYPKAGESFKITLYHTPNTGRLPTFQDSKVQDIMKGIYHATVYVRNRDAIMMELKHDTVNENKELWKDGRDTRYMPYFVQELINNIEVWSAKNPLTAGQSIEMEIAANNTNDTLSCRLDRVTNGLLCLKIGKVGKLHLTKNTPPQQDKPLKMDSFCIIQ